MTNIFDVAKYILEKCGRMSTWKLQKLCYYAQAWALAWTETPLFFENFEAWRNGPVCPELFAEHKGMFLIGAEDLTKGISRNLSEDQQETIDVVINDYGTMEPYELRELSHNEDPWRNARNGLPDDAACREVISQNAMGRYYGSL